MISNIGWLTTLGLLPLLGVLVLAAISPKNELAAKRITFSTTLVVAATAIVMAMKFQRDNVDFQFVESHSWIPSFGINYAVGVDGIALVLILLSVLLAPIVVLAGWNESHGGRGSAKGFYILFLVLRAMLIGLVSSTGVVLFYFVFGVFLNIGFIPGYFKKNFYVKVWPLIFGLSCHGANPQFHHPRLVLKGGYTLPLGNLLIAY